MAAEERFELSKPFWGLHDFQSCALDQARRLLRAPYGRVNLLFIAKCLLILLAFKIFVNRLLAGALFMLSYAFGCAIIPLYFRKDIEKDV